MKHILITGKGSYIGTSLADYLAKWPENYQVETLDMVDGSWRDKDFSGYDSLFHVAGIAHISTKKLDEAARDNYWKVNADLPVEVAKKAKEAGIPQFIFLSSMSVYGQHGSIKDPVTITTATPTNPKDIYGQSKLAAEEGLLKLLQPGFAVALLRPPMIYGPGSRGNYQSLIKAARKLPFFPDISNQRSMLHVDGLCSFVKALVDEGKDGLFFPQDNHYVCTSHMVRDLALSQGKTIRLTRVFNPFLRFLSGKMGVVDKVFGGLVYAQDTRAGLPHNVADSQTVPAALRKES